MSLSVLLCVCVCVHVPLDSASASRINTLALLSSPCMADDGSSDKLDGKNTLPSPLLPPAALAEKLILWVATLILGADECQ